MTRHMASHFFFIQYIHSIKKTRILVIINNSKFPLDKKYYLIYICFNDLV
ncbi:hypothetical protein CBFG_01320 [Clostridiales bacterium 1_7_47FAA]|nr:hypothetical protein CBFG_01320 [Clostridiales bacterium 1_7_47FAA]